MPLSTTDQLHLNTAAGFLQIGDALAAWNELEEIDAKNRGTTEVLTARLAVCRPLGQWEMAEDVARTLIKREPNNIMHVVALAEVMGKREGPPSPLLPVYEFAMDNFQLGFELLECVFPNGVQSVPLKFFNSAVDRVEKAAVSIEGCPKYLHS